MGTAAPLLHIPLYPYPVPSWVTSPSRWEYILYLNLNHNICRLKALLASPLVLHAQVNLLGGMCGLLMRCFTPLPPLTPPLPLPLPLPFPRLTALPLPLRPPLTGTVCLSSVSSAACAGSF